MSTALSLMRSIKGKLKAFTTAGSPFLEVGTHDNVIDLMQQIFGGH